VLLTILTPVLGITLVQKFGAAGAAAGTAIAFLVATGYLLLAFHRNYVEDSVRTVLSSIYVRPLTAGIFAAVSVKVLHGLMPQIVAWESVRHWIPLKMALDFAIFAPTYLLLLVVLRQITTIDWNNFLSLLAFGFELLRHPYRERVKIYR
jgi:putative polysaccharide biosynthesis protein